MPATVNDDGTVTVPGDDLPDNTPVSEITVRFTKEEPTEGIEVSTVSGTVRDENNEPQDLKDVVADGGITDNLDEPIEDNILEPSNVFTDDTEVSPFQFRILWDDKHKTWGELRREVSPNTVIVKKNCY